MNWRRVGFEFRLARNPYRLIIFDVPHTRTPDECLCGCAHLPNVRKQKININTHRHTHKHGPEPEKERTSGKKSKGDARTRWLESSSSDSSSSSSSSSNSTRGTVCCCCEYPRHSSYVFCDDITHRSVFSANRILFIIRFHFQFTFQFKVIVQNWIYF